MQYKINKLNQCVKLLRTNGTKLAEAERDYKVLLCQSALKLKAEGMPVTLIDKVIYGRQDVAEKRFARDVAQVIYDANQESINSLKLQIRIIEAQIGREMGQTKYD